MRVEITTLSGTTETKDRHQQIEARVWYSLGRFSSIIRVVSVNLGDRSNDSDSRPSCCTLTIRRKDCDQPIAVTTTATDVYEAAAAGLDRCRRTIERHLDVAAIVDRSGSLRPV